MYNIGHINLDSDFFNLNKPFFSLYKNLELFNKKISKISFLPYNLANLQLNINGVKDKFLISNNELFVKDYKETYIKGENYFKTDLIYNNKTPLNFKEIKNYMRDNGYISKYMYFSEPLSKDILKKSNFISIDEANKDGFKKHTDISVSYLSIKFDQNQLDSNYLLNTTTLNSFFISKDGNYSVTLKNATLKNIYTKNVTIEIINVKNYKKDEDKYFVPLISDIYNSFVKVTDETNLYIKTPSLNSPINNQSYNNISDNYISLKNKEIKSISFKREKDIESNDVISIGEANNLISNIIDKKMNISFENSEDFLKFIKLSCFSELFLKKDLVVESNIGYVSSDANQFESSVNHLAFNHLLKTRKNYDVSCQECNITDSGEIHFAEYDAQKKEKIQKMAETLKVDLDFSKDTFGKIFAAICELVMKLSYPNKTTVKQVAGLKVGEPLIKDSFIMLSPIFNYSPKMPLGSISFVKPFYAKEHNTFVTVPAILNYSIKNKPYISFNMPFVSKNSNSLVMFESHIVSSHAPTRISNKINIPAKIAAAKCGLNTNPSIVTSNLVSQFIVHSKDGKFGIVSSKRAFNNIDAAYVYLQIINSLKEKYYSCQGCLMKKDVAAVLLTYKAIDYLHKKHPQIPIKVNLSEILKETTNSSGSNGRKNNTEEYLCGNSNSSDDSTSAMVLGYFKTNSNYKLTCKIQQTNIATITGISIDDWRLDKIKENSMNFMNNFATFWDFKTCDSSKHKANTLDLKGSNYTNTYNNVGKFHVNYTFDVLGGTPIGYINNGSPCSKTFTNNSYKIEYVRLITIFGKDTKIPTTLQDNKNNLDSDVVSKLYVVSEDNTKLEKTISLTSLSSFNKREKTYIISIGKEKSFNYLDIKAKMFYSTSGLKAEIKQDKNDNSYYIIINKLKIGPVSINTIDNQKLAFPDSSLICETTQLLAQKEMKNAEAMSSNFGSGSMSSSFDASSFIKTNSLLWPIVSKSFWTSMKTPATAKPDIVVDVKHDAKTKDTPSQANLESKAAISSPVCELFANEEDRIPANFTAVMRTSAFLADSIADKNILININTPIGVGVIDGLFSSDAPGELLVLASNESEIEKLKQEYSFKPKIYVAPINSDLYKLSDKKEHKKIEIDFKDLFDGVLNQDNSPFLYKDKSLSDILNGDLDNVKLTVQNIAFDNYSLRFKSVTSNPSYPIAIADRNLALNPIKSDANTYENMLKFGIPYYINEDEQKVHIYLPKRELYDTGIKIDFTQQQKQS